MTVKECYEAMGADYDGVFSRLRTDERIKKFLLKVLDDKSYDLLLSSLESKNMEDAFRAAHTLKGISQNLSITRLYSSSSELSEALRDRQDHGDEINPILKRVNDDYFHVTECIKSLTE